MVWRVGRSALAVLMAVASAAQAAGPKTDPDWPCRQNKVSEFPLASVWDGPPIETSSTAWRDDPVTARLADEMSQRRVPIGEVQGEVSRLAASADPKAKEKIAAAFRAAFEELVRQRSEIIAGLDRFGRKQRELADRIRAENETARDNPTPGLASDDQALQKLQWDLRVFDERRQAVSYVCEAPQAIEARIGALVKLVRPALISAPASQ